MEFSLFYFVFILSTLLFTVVSTEVSGSHATRASCSLDLSLVRANMSNVPSSPAIQRLSLLVRREEVAGYVPVVPAQICSHGRRFAPARRLHSTANVQRARPQGSLVRVSAHVEIVHERRTSESKATCSREKETGARQSSIEEKQHDRRRFVVRACHEGTRGSERRRNWPMPRTAAHRSTAGQEAREEIDERQRREEIEEGQSQSDRENDQEENEQHTTTTCTGRQRKTDREKGQSH